jgi:hypothetical protein
MYLLVKYKDSTIPIPDTLNLKNYRMTLHYSDGRSENFFPDIQNDIWESEISDKIYKSGEGVNNVEQILIIKMSK